MHCVTAGQKDETGKTEKQWHQPENVDCTAASIAEKDPVVEPAGQEGKTARNYHSTQIGSLHDSSVKVQLALPRGMDGKDQCQWN